MAEEDTAAAGENPLPCGIPATVGAKWRCITSATVTKLLLTIHVLAAIVAIGPVTVAASMFPAATRRALAGPADPRDAAVLRNLHRISRVYAVLGVLVPVFGLATASSLGVLTDAWLLTSIVLTVLAAGVLALLILPGQAAVLAALPAELAGAQAVSSAGGAGGAAVRAPGSAEGVGRSVGTGSGYVDLAGDAGRPADDAARSAATSTDTADVGVARATARRLGMLTGIFNLLWAVVVVLMIVRPGSTTGA
jgi:hypothetical protein